MKPYKFEPYLKTTLWGGYQIAPFKGIFTAQPNIGESWEISGVPGHESRAIERGLIDDVDVGLTLTELIDKYKGLLVGQKVYKKYGNKFPLLVKFIDSRQDLSVQVHPDDKLAMERHGCQGKTEMWYVIKSDVGAKIYSGLKKSITPDEYEQLANATVPDVSTSGSHSPMQDVIATHEAHDGDLYFLPAGRLHAATSTSCLPDGCTPLVPATSWLRFRRRPTSPTAFTTSDERMPTAGLASCISPRRAMPSTTAYGLNTAAATTRPSPYRSSSTVRISWSIASSSRWHPRSTSTATRLWSSCVCGARPTSTASASGRERPSSYRPAKTCSISSETPHS